MTYEQFKAHLRTAVVSGRLTEPQAANWRRLFTAHTEWTLETLSSTLDDPDFKRAAQSELAAYKKRREAEQQARMSKKPESTAEPLHGLELVAASINKQFEERTATPTPKAVSASGLHGKARIADAINRKFGANGGY